MQTWVWPWARGAPKIWGFPLIFLQRLKVATLTLACRWAWPRSIKKSHPEKSGRDHGLQELPNILGFPFNISAKAKSSDFKFGMQLGFAKAHHKITPRGKVDVGLA